VIWKIEKTFAILSMIMGNMTSQSGRKHSHFLPHVEQEEYPLVEAEHWIAEQMNHLFHREVDAQALLRLCQASEMLEGFWGNAAILLDEGHSEAEVAQYFVKYMLLPEDKASS